MSGILRLPSSIRLGHRAAAEIAREQRLGLALVERTDHHAQTPAYCDKRQ